MIEVTLQEASKSRGDTPGEALWRGFFLAANISLKKLENPIFRDVLETSMSIKLPSEAILRLKHLPSIYRQVMAIIKDNIEDGSL